MNNHTKSDSRFIAWETGDPAGIDIQTAPIGRDWMDTTGIRFAYRCLPLVIANQFGWVMCSPVCFSACWNGGHQPSDIQLIFPQRSDSRIMSHFGEGVLTFSIPYLFQTPPEVNLWVKGPSNLLKDGIQPLEGIVETDWLESTFTMNWRFTRPNVIISFEQEEPFCMLVPIPRGFIDSLYPEQRSIEENPELQASYEHWKRSRSQFNAELKQADSNATKQGWQRNYMLGRDNHGKQVIGHQTKLQLRQFIRSTSKDAGS